MLWFGIALIGALSQAVYSLSVKVLLRSIPPFFLAGYSFLAASLILFPLVLWSGIPPLGVGLIPAAAATVVINTVATILFYRALSTTDLSLCIPILAFTPVFLILTSFIILGEIPSLAGVAGIFLIASGAFMLTRDKSKGQSLSLFAPFQTLRHSSGVRSMLMVAFLYSLSVNYDKEVVINSSPLFGSALILFLLALVFLIIAGVTNIMSMTIARNPVDPDPVPISRSSLVLVYGAVGMVLALEGISINTAYTMAIVPYVISIKRLSIFFSVLFGWLLLHEQHIRGRISGALVMIAGAVVIGLWG